MWRSRKTDLQAYFTVNVGLHFVQHQPTLFSPTYEMVDMIERDDVNSRNFICLETGKLPW